MLRAGLAALMAIAAVPAQGPVPADPIEAALARHIAILADDAMEGRKPGTPGGDRAVAYISAQMQAAGLEPGARDGGWLQPVALNERRAPQASMQVRTEGGRISIRADALALLGSERRVRLRDAPVIFAGYGLPETMAKTDVKGAILLMFAGTPEGAKDPPAFDERRAAMAARGAVAVLTLIPAGASWPTVREQYRSGRTTLAGDGAPPVIGAISPDAWGKLLARAKRDPGRAEQDARAPGFAPIPLGTAAELRAETRIGQYSSSNVIGRLRGTGAEQAGAILLTAHWDHLGICRGPRVKDRICNGAVDNASGIAALIEIAAALARAPRSPRDIYFVATTAEESGLLGARALVRDPPTPVAGIAAGLNLDTIALAPRGSPIAVIGRGMTRLDPLIDETARALGRNMVADKDANSLIARQDGWILMKAGIPAVMIGGAFGDKARLQAFFASRYHGPSDEAANGLELGGAAEDVAFHIALVKLLADPKRFPAVAR